MGADLITAAANEELSDLDLDLTFAPNDENTHVMLACAVDSIGNNVNTSRGIIPQAPICCF
ncbi:hypothetical protein ACWGIB_07240 [Streptomyces xiamenensis]